MSRISLVVAWSEEMRAADEFLALQAWVRAQAERVWDRVVPATSLTDCEQGAPALVVGERCLLGCRSLAEMKRAVDGGAEAVTPLRLGCTGLPGLDSIRTLSGIEKVETNVLAAGPQAFEPERPPFAALLLAPSLVEGLQSGDPALTLTDPWFASRAVTVGLCHEFIDYYGEVREDILPFLDSTCRDVLEVGCGRGATGALLQERLGCRVTGVELNPVVARYAARRLQRVIFGDVLEVDPGGPYDAVVACELFEHLTRQDVFLERVRRWLKPGGRLVLSIPNVGHYTIVEDLLAGRWDYLPIGLLCQTHYRFFTRKTLEDSFAAAGFSDIEIVSQKTEAPTWLRELPTTLEIDAESLATHGFYVVLRV